MILGYYYVRGLLYVHVYVNVHACIHVQVDLYIRFEGFDLKVKVRTEFPNVWGEYKNTIAIPIYRVLPYPVIMRLRMSLGHYYVHGLVYVRVYANVHVYTCTCTYVDLQQWLYSI